MARMLLIENPAAARTEPEVVRTVCRVLEREGWEVDVAGTTRPGEARTLAAQGVADKVDVIAVYAGDGTTTQAVGGMIGSGIPLALIPGGTGNLLAGNLGVPTDPARAALIAANGTRRRIDLGRIERPEGPRYFAVACGAGLDAQIMIGAPTERKKKWGSLAYVSATFKGMYGLAAPAHRITVDDRVLEVNAAVVSIANCGRVTSLHFDLGKGIRLDDGLLDVMVIRADGMGEAMVALWELLSGQGNGKGSPHITRIRGRRITVHSEHVRPVQADGDVVGETPLAVEAIPGAIDVMVSRS
jgi:YegS/Rv2252/BmrU family lipid kinase